jgi:two-component system sensor histidine kinase CiaH
MFRSAIIKLTIAYLAIIMFLSLGFSLMLYRISDTELSNGLRRPQQNVFRETSMYDFDSFRTDRLKEGRENLQESLIILNIATFLGGLVLSYFLAQKTLGPIEEAYESQSRFASDASHELRTPLTAMKTEIEVTLRDKNLTLKDAKDQLKSNLEEVDKLRNLSDSLLMLAKDDHSKLSLKKHNLDKILASAISRVEDIAVKRDIAIELENSNLHIVADETSFTELIVIILDNAVKYSPNGKPIKISYSVSDQKVDIVVADKGKGIADEDLPHIFDRFYRADESRTRVGAGGYGLGLSIAKKIALTNRAKVFVLETSKRGTSFAVRVNLA